MKEIILTKDIKKILQILNNNGKGYVVGGYIRDTLLGLKPKDCDFCTDIDYENLKKIFKDYSPKEIGKAFGIIQINYRGNSYEIAKLRKDIEFTEERNVTGIEFINSIEEDLQRRDFTVNAIAFDGKKLIFSSEIGKYDIDKRILRFVGEANKRIEEDPLRILRAIRIASEKGLKILDESKKAIFEQRETIKRVSVERIQDELFKILKGENSAEAIELLNSLGILEQILPNVSKNIEEKKKIEYLKFLDKNFKNEDIILKLVVLFLNNQEDIGKLKLDGKRKKILKDILINFDMIEALKTDYDIKKILQVVGKETLLKLLQIKSYNYDIGFLKNKIEEIYLKNDPIQLKDLKINGADIIGLGVTDGLQIKKYLELGLEKVLKNPKLNNKDILLKLIKEDL
ncbi:CCA tRNA nucleotidyltransferase [Cetobacterium sp. 8H]|uniref:CCA tRNA nucleotidyltransferase n=1 Tax=Cetobacterium sp. 8H TaxID=2759681 RepID=UPI00163D274A|nr:CCA tRNA nucleotidyltransferase [Cetobacterium sp. 8H]MBC2851350.1 CCA tRNA nucleotidyltransferase [Cetobacterium sp. 8H]